MALDHYVSQVYLKNFYSPALGEAFFAMRKDNNKIFPQTSAAVCRIQDNSSNLYLTENRIVEEFLKDIEPKYNKALKNLGLGKIDDETIYVIAGFVAYVLACSPAGMRIHSAPLKATVEETSKQLESMGKLPEIPETFEGITFSELIKSKKIEISIDRKYPQAIGISNILSSIKGFGNATWEILINPLPESPFFTSDFPILIEETRDKRILNRIVPLAPFLAIRICPNINFDRDKDTFDFSDFKFMTRKIDRKDVHLINKKIVRCAETIVFFRDNFPWVSKFIQKNSNYRIEPKTYSMPYENGTFLFSTQEIVEKLK